MSRVDMNALLTNRQPQEDKPCLINFTFIAPMNPGAGPTNAKATSKKGGVLTSALHEAGALQQVGMAADLILGPVSGDYPSGLQGAA